MDELDKQNDDLVKVIKKDYILEPTMIESFYNSKNTITTLNQNKQVIINKISESKTSFNNNQLKEIEAAFNKFDKNIEYLKKQKEKEAEEQHKKAEKENEESKIAAGIANTSFSSHLISYDGKSIADVMADGDYTNLIHDGVEYYYFRDNNVFYSTRLGSYAHVYTGGYKINFNDHVIILEQQVGSVKSIIKIPYQYNNELILLPRTDTDAEGHKWTWEFIKDPLAKKAIDDKYDGQLSIN